MLRLRLLRKLISEAFMKNGILIGVALGVITATALYQRTMQKKDGAFKRGASSIVKKIGDMLD